MTHTERVARAIERDASGETVCGFRVAAYRETHPEHGDKYGHRYSEHWSTPSTRDPRVKVERLFTESQLREALTAIDEKRDALREALELACSWADIDLSKRNTVTSRGIAALIEGGDQRDIDAVRDIVQRRQQSKARSLSSVSDHDKA